MLFLLFPIPGDLGKCARKEVSEKLIDPFDLNLANRARFYRLYARWYDADHVGCRAHRDFLWSDGIERVVLFTRSPRERTSLNPRKGFVPSCNRRIYFSFGQKPEDVHVCVKSIKNTFLEISFNVSNRNSPSIFDPTFTLIQAYNQIALFQNYSICSFQPIKLLV